MLILRNQTQPTNEPNYDLFDLNTFSSNIPKPPKPTPIPANPTPAEPTPAPSKPADPYSNFDILDDIPVAVDQTPAPTEPVPEAPDNANLDAVEPEPVKTDANTFNLDFLGGQTENEMKTTANPNLGDEGFSMGLETTQAKTTKEPEFLADDTIWLNERELDSSGRNGLKIFGKWFLKLKSKLFLRVTIWNKNAQTYRSPRLDIKDNYYNILFLKEGVGVPFKSLEPGEFVTLEKGKQTPTNPRNVQKKGGPSRLSHRRSSLHVGFRIRRVRIRH